MRIGVSLPVRELADDLAGIAQFAQEAEGLGFTHLRIPDQVIRPDSGHLHEPLTLLCYIAAVTETIELVPSVSVLPVRQTVLVAKQAAEVDRLSGGRLRFGVGVGGNADEYAALGQDFHTRGKRCDEQIALLRRLWTEESVDFEGRWDRVAGAGIDPLPVQQPIPIWIGGSGSPSAPVVKRIARLADGWFALMAPEDFRATLARIEAEAQAAGREAAGIGSESAVAIVGSDEGTWTGTVAAWKDLGVSHLGLRTLGGGLDARGHVQALSAARKTLANFF